MGNDDKTKFVRIDRETVEAVESHKEETGISVGKFFELAAKYRLTMYNRDGYRKVIKKKK